ncbi:UNVERIFIED_CONTAM: hypothetical protein RMT77_010451 [Armadillidium vulgare]
MFEIPSSNSLPCNESSFSNYCSNEENNAYDLYFNQSIDHYYNLENHSRSVKFMCDVCAKGFYTHGQYKKHIDEHVKCPFPECGLEGSMKFIDQHISFNHMMINFEATLVDNETWKTERSKRFPRSENVEERRAVQLELLKKEKLRIEAKLKREQQRFPRNEGKNTPKDTEDSVSVDWKAKRNKKFPRLESENLKKAEEIERSKRGERLGKESRRFSKPVTKGKGSNFRRKYRKYDKDREENQEFKSNISKGDDDDCSDSEERYGIQAFKGTKAFYESLGEVSLFGMKSDIISKEKVEELEISDDDFDNCNEPTLEIAKHPCVLHNALGSLMGAYRSDSDVDEKESPPTEQILTPSDCIKEVNSVKTAELAPNNLSDDGKLKETSLNRKRKHRKAPSKDGNESNSRLKGNKICNKKFSERYTRRTLLKKLLEPQIIHERNVILQCVRYIVNNNFFDSEKSVS